MNITECQFCGDSCGEIICYGCQDTGDMLGVDLDEMLDMM